MWVSDAAVLPTVFSSINVTASTVSIVKTLVPQVETSGLFL